MKKIIAVSSPILFLAIGLVFALFSSYFDVAYADPTPTLSSVTAVTEYTLNLDGTVSYTRGVIDPATAGYKKDVEVCFDVGDDDYRLEIKIGSGERTDVTDYARHEGTKVYYRISVDGVITVYASNYVLGERTGETSVTVRSDNVAPTFTTLPGMTDWLRVGQEYAVQVDLSSFSDDLSGVGRAYYQRSDGALHEIEGNDSFAFPIDDVETLTLYFFDRAGNVSTSSTTYDKFDAVLPPDPVIIVTPSSAAPYARYYDVSIEYPADTQSGLTEEKTYALNGKQYVYSEPFRLTEAKAYEISAYSTDRAGNRSSTVTRNIQQDTFDVAGPIVLDLRTEIDLTKNEICTVRATVKDAVSGVSRVCFDGLPTVSFTPSTGDVYVAAFDCYGLSELTLKAEDAAGNVTIEHTLLGLFGDATYSEKIRSYALRYASTDFSKYTAAAKAEIDSAYTELNVIVTSDVATKAEFDTAAARVDASYAPNKSSYVIEEQSDYLTGLLEYNVDFDDFSFAKIGEEVKLVFSAGEPNDALVSAAGFSSGFTDGFSLTVYVGGEKYDGTIEHGIRIYLNLPVGYYDRDFALFADGQTVATEKENQRLAFVMAKNADYVLVVSGSRAKGTEPSAQKYIEVFGRKLGYGAFFGTVFGVVGGVIVIVVVLLLIAKRRG